MAIRMRPLLAMLLCSTLLLSGCAGSDEEHDGDHEATPSGADGTTGTGAETEVAAPQAAPMTHEVTLSGNAFDPPALEIRAGDSVHWTHRDGTSPHNVESDAPAFDSHPDCTLPVPASPMCMTDGDEYTYTFTEAGTVEYRCQVHPGMTATLSVSS